MTEYYKDASHCYFILMSFHHIDAIQSKHLFNFLSTLFFKSTGFKTYKTFNIFNQSNILKAEDYVNNFFKYFFARYFDKYYRNHGSKNDKSGIFNDLITTQIELEYILKFFQQTHQYKCMLMENFCSIKEHYEISYQIFLAILLNITFERNLLMICIDMSCKLDVFVDFPTLFLDTIYNTDFVFKTLMYANLTKAKQNFKINIEKL
ncbi:hypothetical protein COBT_003595, partial [Conglomerata obtusa]